ncbi:MAG TPA: histidine kinase dimerization/phospho-acceptor domain-containing protein [Gemmatimonadaceae bacterium]|nr:histidine kinase dimerization/phospho-acceptor domain-containing protein [Gemmatimonadaceae bacterium]
MTDSSNGPEAPIGDAPNEMQQLTARVQHQLNNPLAALLAEAQMLSMDEHLDGEHRVAVDRIIELTRRVIRLVRELDPSTVGAHR